MSGSVQARAGATRYACCGLLLLCSACSAAYPHCVASGVPDGVGRWQYAGRLIDPVGTQSPPAAELGRPAEIELRADGTYVARFEPAAASTRSAVPAGEMTGQWRGGRFCVEALFAPWAEIGTDPKLPHTASIQLSGGRLIVLGSSSSVNDVDYTPAASVPRDAAPATLPTLSPTPGS